MSPAKIRELVEHDLQNSQNYGSCMAADSDDNEIGWKWRDGITEVYEESDNTSTTTVLRIRVEIVDVRVEVFAPELTANDPALQNVLDNMTPEQFDEADGN